MILSPANCYRENFQAFAVYEPGHCIYFNLLIQNPRQSPSKPSTTAARSINNHPLHTSSGILSLWFIHLPITNSASDNLFKYFNVFFSFIPNATTLRSALLHTLLATCSSPTG